MDCGITIDQELHCWRGRYRQIDGLFTQITVHDFYGCGILTDGQIKCWGNHYFPPLLQISHYYLF